MHHSSSHPWRALDRDIYRFILSVRGDGDIVVVRQNTKSRGRYTLYECKDILRRLDMTWEQWHALAISTAHVYSANKRGYGINKNFSAIKAICQGQPTLDVVATIHIYATSIGEEVSRYEHAFAVFCFHEVTPVEAAPAQSTQVDHHYRRMVLAVGAQLTSYMRYMPNIKYKPTHSPAPRDPKIRQRAATAIDKALAIRYAQVSLDFGTLKRHVDDSLKVFRTLDDSTAPLSPAEQAVVSCEVLAGIRSVVQLKTVLNRKQYEQSSSSAVTAKACSRQVVEEYQAQFTANTVADLKNNLARGVSEFIGQIASHLQSQIVTHFRNMIPRLIIKIKEENFDNLPPSSQVEFFPASGYKDQFTHIPEADLKAAILGKRPPEDNDARKDACDITRRIFGSVKSSYTNGQGSVSPFTPKCVVQLEDCDKDQFLDKAKAIYKANIVDNDYIKTLREFEELIKKGLKFGMKRGPTFSDKFAETLYTRPQGAGVRMHYVSES
ncbi:hypothetical protein KVV02_007336 [Mortierella alpina]|uniref:Uncharacterized protein n=1 Tax=Mortierella alpina TaxID=64518 RepID=A0A9P7ZYL1_MORAP|nr:hypothetical protein KVV02_007336 [Mortierella alpina]